MFRPTDVVLIAVMVSAAAFTYHTKHQAQGVLAEVRKVENRIRLERETIDLLEADWSLLTQPGRLQRLVDAYESDLGLKPIEPYQIARPEELPARPVQLEEMADRNLGGMADTTTTGSIR